MKKDREIWIDMLRGMGALLVLLGHLVSGTSQLKFYIYSFHMPMFFFISGYLFKYKKNIKYLVKDKIKKLIVPYFIFSIISLVITVLLGTRYSIKEIVYGLLFIKGAIPWNSSLWFFIILFYDIIVTNIIFMFVKERKKLLFVIFVLNITLCLVLKRYNIVLPFGVSVMFFSLIFYWLGYIFNNYIPKIKNSIFNIFKNKFMIFPILILFVISFYISNHNPRVVMSQCLYPKFSIFLLLALIGIFIFSYIARRINNNKLLNIFSSLSLIMFSTQRIIFKFIDLIALRLNVTLIGSNNYFIVIGLFIFISMIYLIYYWLKHEMGSKHEK